MGKDEEEKEMPSFYLSSFDIVTFATVIDVATVDGTEGPAKDGSEDGALDGTVGVQRALPQATDGRGGVGCSPSSSTSLNKLPSEL